MSRRAKLLVVRGLTKACEWIDDVAYRPAVVKLTMRLPRWWNCDLTRLSIRLDERWKTGYWDEREWSPAGLLHPVYICSWCVPDLGFEVRDDKAAIDRGLTEAGQESVAWRWRWRTRDELDR